MRVKRLEIQGFKSFKDKTIIHFDHSITGIVGPNGCGKSNIVDAFFWVMGEQSYKHMRGNSSEDLIFNGSSKYSPLGLAEATLVMETNVVDLTQGPTGASVEDLPVHLTTKEVSVTRRLYRSGEGEYYINGTLARLKDIQELFMDTGVGAKGYSVIEQGQIGKIVNAKPEDRRLLIEEAAGIAKYKARKKESLRKMEATQANLARLADIIQEIEKNLDSLERQAQKARLYKKYKDELLDKEMTWGRRKNQLYREKLETLRKQRDVCEQDLIGMRAELLAAENEIEVDQINSLTTTKEAETLQAKIQDLSEDLSQEKSALELSRRRQGDLTSQLLTLEKEKSELQTSITASLEKLKDNENEAAETDQLFQSVSADVKIAHESLSHARRDVDEARSSLDSNQRKLMSEINQISGLTSKAAALLSKADSAVAQKERLVLQAEAQREKHLGIQAELEKAKSSFETVKKQKEALQAEKKEQTAKIQEDDQNLRAAESERNQSLKALTQLNSKLQSLEELDESHEGLADGPKAALDWAKAQGHCNKISALTDTLEVSNGYETVLETWLEARLETLLSENSSLAPPLLEQIRKDKQGRVSVQLLTKNVKKLAASKLTYAEVSQLLEKYQFTVLGELRSFVKSNLESQDYLHNLFGNVCVVQSASPLPDFLKNINLGDLEGWSLVSMDGMALEPTGILRGGSSEFSGGIGILRRKRSIEDLKIQVAESEKQHQIFEENAENAKQTLELSRARLQSLQTELQTFEIQSAALQRDVHQTERALQESKSHLNSLDHDCQELTLESVKAISDREAVELLLTDLLTSRSTLEESISTTEQDLLQKEETLKTEDASLQAIRVKEASLRERSTSLRRELEATRALIHDRERRIGEVEKILTRASGEQAQFSGGESKLEEKIAELVLLLGSAREQLSLVKDSLSQTNSKINRLLDRTKEIHKASDQKTAESTQLALEFEKISSDLSHLTQNLEEKYGPGCLNISSVSPSQENTEGMSPPSVEMTAEEELVLSEEVERLRERIRRLGEVNTMAIEEFDLLKKRYDHLLLEKKDLEHSLENLQDAIEHINKTSVERFKKAFEAIADRFERLFPIIFGGGQAQVSLVYPEGSTDILEAGVDILAQPPGKKVSNITLLSGGEKALTAVSLIFAIFMVKPSPFCVLDEVDAPLDDANIGKFNALLREMSVKSQFILITHNKKTMELNDTLYGVTMEEPGVSKMVSIEMH